MSVWVNIDKPTKQCTIHTSPNCVWVRKMKQTPNKGIGHLKRDGGWLSFNAPRSAQSYCKSNFGHYNVIYCSFCQGLPDPKYEGSTIKLKQKIEEKVKQNFE